MPTPAQRFPIRLFTQGRIAVAAICLALAGIAALTIAEEPIAPDQQKKADEAAAGPDVVKKEAPVVLKVSVSAKPVLDKMREAYGKLTGLQMSGEWVVEFDVDGEKGKEAAPFTSSFAAPNKYRHEVKGDLLFGSTGEKVYAFKRNTYLLADAPKARVAVADLPKESSSLLKEKNPSLLFAMSSDETPYLAEKATAIDKAEDVSIDGKAFTQLKVSTQQGADVTVLVDPATNLMRKWSADMKRALTERGQPNVVKATMTIDYAKVDLQSPAGPEAFAWAPPEGARDAAKMVAGEDPAVALVGKPAPPFELQSLDGPKVKLADLKGHVVVLDFWATWCGPCRVGLPILDAVTQARKDKLKVFAVDLEEDRETVDAFVKETKLGIPVLLDFTGDIGRAYMADGIPLTIIVGKDGLVKKALGGVHDREELEKEVDEVLKG